MGNGVVYITNHDRKYSSMKRVCDELKAEGQISAQCRTLFIEDGAEWDASLAAAMQGSNLVIVHLMKNAMNTPLWNHCRDFLCDNKVPFFIDANDGDVQDSRFIDDDKLARFKLYCLYGGPENYKNLWLYAEYFNDEHKADPPLPEISPESGIYAPFVKESFMESAEDYLKIRVKPQQVIIGLLFYRDEWIGGDLKYQDDFMAAAEKQGCAVIPVFANSQMGSSKNEKSLSKAIRKFFMKDGKPIIDVLVTTMKFSLTGTGKTDIGTLKELNVPIIDAYTLLTPEEDWKADPEGMNAVEVSISAALPELDGVIHSVPVAGRIKENGLLEYRPIHERIARIVSKAYKWGHLHRMKNSDKKIALIFHNFPAGNANIGSASGLDTMESAVLLLQKMQSEGYRIQQIPDSGADLLKSVNSHVTNDIAMMTDKQYEESMKLSGENYQDFFSELPVAVQQDMEHTWGKAPGDVMLDDDGNFLIPGFENGNVFITVQPSRQYGMDAVKLYHDPKIPPTHQYLAFYHWIRDVWKADAVIHLGTHGNLEWLPGKSVGLDDESYPDIALNDLPNIYPYLMTITGEGIIAKRRSSACLIGHLPAPIAEAGAYDELAELEKTLDEYAQLKRGTSDISGIEADIRKLSVAAKLDEEVHYDESEPFEDYAAHLHAYIEELKDSEVHVGLHVLGKAPEGKLLLDCVLQILRLSNGDIPSVFELWAKKYNLTLDDIQTHPDEIYEPLHMTKSQLMEKIREETRKVISFAIESMQQEDCIEQIMNLPEAQGSDAWKQESNKLLDFVIHELIPSIHRTSDEMTNTISALSGQYINPGPSGSPNTGGAGLLPSGRNFYGADPRTLPSPAGWNLGVKLGDRTIAKYIAEKGHYPENIGMVLWSGPNMRTFGQDIAEFLYLLGIKPVWQKGSLKVTGLEVIPLNELKRPRIDVTARISGLFRDTLPQISKLLDQAVMMAAEQDEGNEENFVRKHICSDAEVLKAKGKEETEAWRIASYRIFGNAPGTYGAGVNVILDTREWENTKDLADVYVRWGGHAFGKGADGCFEPELFKKQLARIDLTVKNEENPDSNIMSSDDYNAFHGGMIAAVKSLSGNSPESYVGDSTNRGNVKIRTVNEEVKRIFRSESMNPKYIKGLMEHGYKGASDLANRMAISFQWDATSDVIDDWMYDQYAEKYALDPEMKKWMEKVNPWALKNIAETLLEAEKRKMWNAKDSTKKELEKLYLSIEGTLEEDNDDDDED